MFAVALFLKWGQTCISSGSYESWPVSLTALHRYNKYVLSPHVSLRFPNPYHKPPEDAFDQVKIASQDLEGERCSGPLAVHVSRLRHIPRSDQLSFPLPRLWSLGWVKHAVESDYAPSRRRAAPSRRHSPLRTRRSLSLSPHAVCGVIGLCRAPQAWITEQLSPGAAQCSAVWRIACLPGL